MRNIAFLGAAGLTAVLSSCSQPQQKPNIIFIMADDLGYADITPYGQEIIQTPNLERLAAEGLKFTQTYAGCTVSAPSRASLMTGLHTGHTAIRGNQEVQPEGQMPLPEGSFTLARMFQEAGYETGAFGKWGLGYPGSCSEPEASGFDEFFGYNCQRAAHLYYPDHLWHNGERVDFPENYEDGRKVYSPDLIHSKALDFIRTNKDKPFFAYLSYTLPHAELNLPHDSLYHYYCQAIPAEVDQPYKKGGYPDSERPYASFAAMVSRLDAYVGDVVGLLEEVGVDKNTLIIFTSDNGPHREGGANPDFFKSSGGLRGCKRDLYEGGIRVPMIAFWPGKIKGNSETAHITAFWDMLPTFAELCGYDKDFETDGLSFAPLLRGAGKAEEHQFLYWEFHELGGRQAVRKGDWKAVRLNAGDSSKTSLELYNLALDPGEKDNVAGENAALAAELAKLMDSARTESHLFNFGR